MNLTYPKYKVKPTANNRTIDGKLSDTINVTDYGADPTGLIDSTLAIEMACNDLISGQTLNFPSGTYLVSYKWAPFSDSDPSYMSGRGKAVCYIDGKSGITLNGNNSTIKCINHPIDVYGGFMFCMYQHSPHGRVTGFNFDMSFTGYNTLAIRYPLCGGVITIDKYNGLNTQTTLCSSFEADHLKFKIFHPLGAFSVTTNPYGGTDYNNGHKIIAIFNSGDAAATNYTNQSRGLDIHDIRFLEGHNGYACWGVAYNDTFYKDIHHEALIGSSYNIASGLSSGVNFTGPVRYYQYYCKGFTASNIYAKSIPQANRTGSFVGLAGIVNFHSGLTDQTGGGGTIRNVTGILDSNSTTLASTFDFGIFTTASGLVVMDDIKIDCHQQSAVIGILCGYNDWTGSSDLIIKNGYATKRVNGPFVEMFNGSSSSDNNRPVKSLSVSDCIIRGFGSLGAIFSSTTAGTYYGAEYIKVYNCLFDGTNSISPGYAIDVRGRTNADSLMITNNKAVNSTGLFAQGSSSYIASDNATNGLTANGGINYLSNYLKTFTVFTSGLSVSIPGINTGELYEYSYLELNSTGGVVAWTNNYANSSGSLRSVGAGNVGYLTYKKVTTQR